MVSNVGFGAHHADYSCFYYLGCLHVISRFALSIVNTAGRHLVEVELIKVLLGEYGEVGVTYVLDESPDLNGVTEGHEGQQKNIISLERELVGVGHEQADKQKNKYK